MLTARQIDRYSRQIITHGFGGGAQERLLASRILVSGSRADLEPVLPYLVGAGVGQITLDVENCASTAIAALEKRFADLNPDVRVTTADQPCDNCDLILTLLRHDQVANVFGAHATEHSHSPLILVRLAAAASIAIIPSRPPCLICADANLTAPLTGQCDNPSGVAMMAAVEAIKLLAGTAPAEARLIEFAGYAATPRPLRRSPDVTSCGCAPPTA